MTVIITNEQDKVEIAADWSQQINEVAAICPVSYTHLRAHET